MISLEQREIDNSNRKIIIRDTKYLLVGYLGLGQPVAI
jgi:hypothetical protein